VLAPAPVAGIDHVAAAVHTAPGTLAVDWTTDGTGGFAARYTIPFGVTAVFHPPAADGAGYSLDGTPVFGPRILGPGRHEVQVPDARIVDPAVPSLP
jgi:hypothetical protein